MTFIKSTCNNNHNNRENFAFQKRELSEIFPLEFPIVRMINSTVNTVDFNFRIKWMSDSFETATLKQRIWARDCVCVCVFVVVSNRTTRRKRENQINESDNSKWQQKKEIIAVTDYSIIVHFYTFINRVRDFFHSDFFFTLLTLYFKFYSFQAQITVHFHSVPFVAALFPPFYSKTYLRAIA